MLLNEKVGFVDAEKPGTLERKVLARWEQEWPAQLAPYCQTLAALGVTVNGQGVITQTSDAWFDLPLPDPARYLHEMAETLRSICGLIDQVTAEHKNPRTDRSFQAPGFLERINDHRYNAREDTLINSQYIVRFPEGGEHRYVVETR